jgi:hypothetical protein
MADFGQGPRSGSRDNGLRCAGYVAVGDLDPRVADALLSALRDEGIAAYVTPSPRTQGGWLEVQHPTQLTDRLFADADRADRAKELLSSEREESIGSPAPSRPGPEPAATSPSPSGGPSGPDDEIDFDSAWQELLGSLQSTTSAAARPWPASEEVEPGAFAPPASGTLDEDPALDEHFVPPPPPPLPRLRPSTIVGWLAILLGLVILATGFDGGDLTWLAVLSILGGAGTLIWHVKEGPPPDSGWDDGAVV